MSENAGGTAAPKNQSPPKIDSAAALKWLKWVNNSPQYVYSVSPQGGDWRAHPVSSATLEQTLAGLAGKNVYYSPAQPMARISGKPTKEQITSTQLLWVDIDPSPGRDADDIDLMLMGDPDKSIQGVIHGAMDGVPVPTAIVYSGRGFQCYWRLSAPLSMPEHQEAAEASMRYLTQKLMGDSSCAETSHVLRLVGTVNHGSAKKGPLNNETFVAHLEETRTYTLADFGTVAPTRSKAAGRGPADIDSVTTEYHEIDSLPAWCDSHGIENTKVRYYICGGDHDRLPGASGPVPSEWDYGPIHTPANDTASAYQQAAGTFSRGDGSTSAALFAVVAECLRKGVPDCEILSMLLDPRPSFAQHVTKAKDPLYEARRQIARIRAKVEAEQTATPAPADIQATEPPLVLSEVDRAIAEINEKHFAVLNGGKIMFFREDAGHVLTRMDERAFHLLWATRQIKISGTDARGKDKTSLVPASKLWLTHPDRRIFANGLVLDPENADTGAYNLWRGFTVAPKAGDWSLMRQHILEVLAGGDVSYADYITKWAAWSVQNPSTPPRVALVFRGAEGTGKGTFANALVDLFGNQVHGLRVQNMQHLVGKFNAHLRHCCFLFVDEALAPNSDGFGALKGLVTEPTIPIEAKGVDLINAENHLHVCFASNEQFVLPAGPDARRWAVFDVSDKRKGDTRYFDALYDQMKNGGLAAMLHDMLQMDLSGWTPEGARPTTQALNDQKAYTLQGFEAVMLDLLKTGELPEGCSRGKGKRTFFRTSTLAEFADRRRRSNGVPVTSNSVATLLKDLGFERCTDTSVRGFECGSLKEARKRWDEKRFTVKWDEDVTEWSVAYSDRPPDSDGQLF